MAGKSPLLGTRGPNVSSEKQPQLQPLLGPLEGPELPVVYLEPTFLSAGINAG